MTATVQTLHQNPAPRRQTPKEQFEAQHAEWAAWPAQDFGTADTYGVKCDPRLKVTGFKSGHPLALAQDKNYIPNGKMLFFLNAFAKKMSRPLLIWGPPGAGKTYEVEQFFSRLNWPTLAYSWGAKKEAEELIGLWQVPEGMSTFIHGPLALAMKIGALLLVNEIDRAHPGDLVMLNDILEGKRLVIPSNGNEVIVPHPRFRLVFTANSGGGGDESGTNHTIREQDPALMSRVDAWEVMWPEEDEELKRVLAHFPTLNKEVATKMIRVANATRKAFLGGGNAAQQLRQAITPRELLAWADNAVKFQGAPNAVRLGLELAYLNKRFSDEKQHVHVLAKGIFDKAWDNA